MKRQNQVDRVATLRTSRNLIHPQSPSNVARREVSPLLFHRSKSPIPRTAIILFVAAVLELIIYILYRHADQVIIAADNSINHWLQPEMHHTVIRTEHDLLEDPATRLARTSKSLGYGKSLDPLHTFPDLVGDSFFEASTEETGVDYTLKMLEEMGVNRTELVERGLLDQLPPWWQIIKNYGKDPVILGLERCQIFQERVGYRHIAPTGLFSSGTNLLQQLLYNNCVSPMSRRQPQGIFNLWQVPWGKHNPASARLQHIAKNQEARNQSAVLPVVTVRHPYAWLRALCRYSYSLFWNHRPEKCDKSLSLHHAVRANFGSSVGNITYDTLVHVWRDWNLAYFEQTEYPMLMVRLEDLVYRPKAVIEQVCHCAGGKLKSEIETRHSFEYLQDNANLGHGHGNHRSDLVSAVIRYGQALKVYKSMFTKGDWDTINQVLDDDHGLSSVLAYRN